MDFRSNKLVPHVQDAQIALKLARLTLKTTEFEGGRTSAESDSFYEELDSAKEDVIAELMKLDQLYHHLNQKRQERDDNIASAEQELIDFIKVKDDRIAQLQAE
ncbi:MAG: hypothetical protein ACFFD4_28460, partial [Candidatus Odinarchaeota archaeon]